MAEAARGGRSAALYAHGVAIDKPGRTKRSGAAAPDPRVDDPSDGQSATRSRSRISRPARAENPLDRITSFDSPSPLVPGVPSIVPADVAESESAEESVPAAVLTETPPLLPAPEALPVIAPAEPDPPTVTVPVVDSPTSAAELLDLGGRRQRVPDDGYVEHTATVDRVLEPLAQLRTPHRPVVFRKSRRPRVRRVTRVLRHVDTWSVFKVALVFALVLYVVCLTAGVLLWNVAHTTGTIDNVENFFEQFGWESFEFRGGEIYHNAWVAGLFVAIGLTGFAVLLATLFNLITDLVGGIRVTVLEEEVVARSAPRTPRVRETGLNLAGPVAEPLVLGGDPNAPVSSGT